MRSFSLHVMSFLPLPKVGPVDTLERTLWPGAARARSSSGSRLALRTKFRFDKVHVFILNVGSMWQNTVLPRVDASIHVGRENSVLSFEERRCEILSGNYGRGTLA